MYITDENLDYVFNLVIESVKGKIIRGNSFSRALNEILDKARENDEDYIEMLKGKK